VSLLLPAHVSRRLRSFINTLFMALMKEYAVNSQRFQKPFEHTVDIEVLRAGMFGPAAVPSTRQLTPELPRKDIEEKGFACRLTLIDCPGFGDYVNNADCWAPVVDYLEDQHQAYLDAEEQSVRNDIDDMRVHACLYFIQPTGHTWVAGTGQTLVLPLLNPVILSSA
jgi:cell division control protein 12